MSNQNKERLKKIAREISNKDLTTLKLRHLLNDAINNQIDLNEKMSKGRTLMHYAVKANRKGIVRLLASYGVNPLICDESFNTPLHQAVVDNKYQVLVELLKLPIDIDAPGEFDRTPLHVAVINGNLEIVKLLIKHGADVFLVDEHNFSALQYAIDENDQSIINYLQKIEEIQKGK